MKKINIFIVLLFLYSNTFTSVFAQKDSTDNKNLQITGFPSIGYNNSFGVQLGAMGMMIFNINKSDTISPPSSLNAMGFYTGNKTWFGLLAQRLYFQQDNWRAVWAVRSGNINFQTFVDELPSSSGLYIDYNTKSKFAYGALSHKVAERLYAGLSFSYHHVNTTFYFDEPFHFERDSAKNLVGIGIPFEYDSRDYIFNPSKGIYAKLRTVFNQDWVGSDLNFNTLDLEANYYLPLKENVTLANRLTAYTGLGEIPFEGQKVVGRNDIRGYTKGKYRGDQVYSLQSEYRYSFKNKFGVVGFAGLAAAFTSEKDKNKWSGILPGVGAGVRYKAIPARRINVGIDAAVGKEDWGVYFRIGEAF